MIMTFMTAMVFTNTADAGTFRFIGSVIGGVFNVVGHVVTLPVRVIHNTHYRRTHCRKQTCQNVCAPVKTVVQSDDVWYARETAPNPPSFE